MNFPDLLLAADEIVAALDERPIYDVTLHARTIDGIYPHVQIHLQGQMTPGAMLELAVETGLTEVDVFKPDTGTLTRIRGKHEDFTVEYMAAAA